MDIQVIAERIVKQSRSRNPFTAAQNLGVVVLFEPLGSIRGYYSKSMRQKFIHINKDLPEYQARFVCAHELGHAVMHGDTNTPFLKSSTLLSVNKFELEANKFAACFLLPDCKLWEYIEYEYTIEQAAISSGLPAALINYRLDLLSLNSK